MSFSFIHVWALSWRYFIVLRRSLPRIFDLFWWQAVAIFLWGFLTIYLNRFAPENFNFLTLLLGGLFFWELFFRSNLTLAMSFLEDIWARNLVNIFVAPVSVAEFLSSVILVSVLKTLIALAAMTALAGLFLHFNIFTFGLALIPFGLLLFVFGWSMGIVTTGIVLRFGQSAEYLAWSLPVLVQPLSAVFYPVDAIPAFLRPLSYALPTTHIFEGMREVIATGALNGTQLFYAAGLDIIFLALALFFFLWMLRLARERGFLVRLATE